MKYSLQQNKINWFRLWPIGFTKWCDIISKDLTHQVKSKSVSKIQRQRGPMIAGLQWWS